MDKRKFRMNFVCAFLRKDRGAYGADFVPLSRMIFSVKTDNVISSASSTSVPFHLMFMGKKLTHTGMRLHAKIPLVFIRLTLLRMRSPMWAGSEFPTVQKRNIRQHRDFKRAHQSCLIGVVAGSSDARRRRGTRRLNAETTSFLQN